MLKKIKNTMVNEFILDEIMKIDSDNSVSLFKSLFLLSKFNVELISDKNYNTVYRVKKSDILESNLDDETLIKLRKGGWGIDENNEYLIKILK